MQKKLFKWKMGVKDIALISMILSLYISFKFLSKLNPEIMPGLKIELMDVIVVVSSLIFGAVRTAIAISIFYFIIAWISPSHFISGITWVHGSSKIVGVYFLDYIIPHLIVAIVPSLFILWKNKLSPIVFSFIAVWMSLIFHIGSGVLFWSSYAWNGWGPVSYSIAANCLVYSAALPLSVVLPYPIAYKVRPLFINNHNQSTY